MTMDLFVARMMITKASLVFQGTIKFAATQVCKFSFDINNIGDVIQKRTKTG